VTPVTVTLEATDASGPSIIRYRLDDDAWATYTGPLVVGAGVHTFEYYAVDPSGLQEPLQSKSISVDLMPPSATASIDGTSAAGWYTEPVLVRLVASDDLSGIASLVYRIDGGAWEPYAAAIVLDDGVSVLEYYAADVAGHAEPVKMVTVSVDGTGPSIAGLPATMHAPSSAVVVSWSGVDAISGIDRFEMSVDEGPFVSLGNTESAELHLADGSHTIVIRAFDRAGNVGSTNFVVTVDTNVFSASGPYGPAPLLTFAVVIAAVVAGMVIARRRKGLG